MTVITSPLKEVRRSPLLSPLVLGPVVLIVQALKPEAHTLLFILSILAIVPLAALLSLATESVAAKTGETVGGRRIQKFTKVSCPGNSQGRGNGGADGCPGNSGN